jgi:hypothetical protein
MKIMFYFEQLIKLFRLISIYILCIWIYFLINIARSLQGKSMLPLF